MAKLPYQEPVRGAMLNHQCICQCYLPSFSPTLWPSKTNLPGCNHPGQIMLSAESVLSPPHWGRSQTEWFWSQGYLQPIIRPLSSAHPPISITASSQMIQLGGNPMNPGRCRLDTNGRYRESCKLEMTWKTNPVMLVSDTMDTSIDM